MSKSLSNSMNGKMVKALVVRSAGTNCDQETIHALTLCGAETDLVHINQLMTGRIRLHPYQLIVIPGGFSYGDDISAGKVLANELKYRLKDQLLRFVEAKKPIVGICNGFQVLVKTGLLPGFDSVDEKQLATLTLNDSSRFQCEWVGLKFEKSRSEWLNAMPKNVEFPIAHGEGKFITAESKILKQIRKNNQVFLRYHPRNPNGSEDNIAGICNKGGNVIGMMPHPERFVNYTQHPNWPAQKEGRKSEKGDGFWFWSHVVEYAKQHA